MKHSSLIHSIDRPPAKRVLGPLSFLALSFGCIVGSGWVVVLGDWLRACGPAGVVLGMVAGGSVMLANSGAYAELIARYPLAGGDFVFAQRAFGDRTAFFVGWLWTLSLISVAVFEATALPWLLETLIPAMKGSTLYVSLDTPVTADALAVDLVGTAVVAIMNYRGAHSAATMQTVLSFVFLLLAALIISLGFILGSLSNLRPLVHDDHAKPWWLGALWIFAIAPMFLNGFQSVAQTAEERTERVTFARIAASMAFALLIAIGFYCLVTLAAASAKPWQALLDRPMVTAAAFADLLPHHVLSMLVLAAAALSVVRIWNGVTIWTVRLLLAQARAGFLPAWLGATHPRHGSPTAAVIFVAACTALGALLGRGAIIPLVDMASLCLAGNLVLACIAALRVRATHQGSSAPYSTPGGAFTLLYALAGSSGMAVFAFVDPILRRPGKIPAEWIVMGVWASMGMAFWFIWRPFCQSKNRLKTAN
jgi:basic amino acid/polyamine antiporter, APA family